MQVKLTLSVDKSTIEASKAYAKSNGRSLSNIIEEYLKSLVVKHESESEADFEISPVIKSLWGSVKPFPKSKSYKEMLEEELAKKYS